MRDRSPTLRADLIAGLVLAGAFTTACRPHAGTPLTAAAADGDLRQVKRLIADGADVNSLADRFTPLDWAARKGRVEVIHELARAGARLDLRDRGVNGWTALMHAVHKGQSEAVVALLDLGADANARADGGVTALMLAAGGGDFDQPTCESVILDEVQALLDHGADPHAVSESGVNALTNAVAGGHASVVRVLLDRGVVVSGGWRAELSLWWARLRGEREILSMLGQG